MNHPTEIVVEAPGKINLTLDVLDRRADGYHDIESIMQTIALADSVCVALADESGIALSVDGPFATGAPHDERNLAVRAARRILDAAKCERGLRIKLTKNLPSQAGLGGGSSDAAAVLTAVNRLLDGTLTREQLLPIAATLGADVPFFLFGGAARISGIGERVEPIDTGLSLPVVLVKPPVGVSTAAAYASLDNVPHRQSAYGTASWPERGISNDFEAVVFDMAPEIAAARDALILSGASATVLCGSGATVAGFGDDARALAAAVSARGVGQVWLTHFTSAL